MDSKQSAALTDRLQWSKDQLEAFLEVWSNPRLKGAVLKPLLDLQDQASRACRVEVDEPLFRAQGGWRIVDTFLSNAEQIWRDANETNGGNR